MNSAARTLSSDTLGIAFSSICVVHCIATPLLLSASPLFARYLPGEEYTHALFAVVVAVLGSMSVVNGFRMHRRALILALMCLGLVCIGAGAFLSARLPAWLPEVAVTLAGSALMISTHRLNHTFCRSCRSCNG